MMNTTKSTNRMSNKAPPTPTPTPIAMFLFVFEELRPSVSVGTPGLVVVVVGAGVVGAGVVGAGAPKEEQMCVHACVSLP